MASSDRHPERFPRVTLPEDAELARRLRFYRRWLPAPIALALLLFFRPELSGSPSLDTLIITTGFLLCATGQSLRLWAWGSNAEIGASGVRDRGAYVLMRHPLYVGNFLIASGLAVTYNNPVAYFLVVLPFAVTYVVIARNEERYISETFPADYPRYLAQSLPRFFPALNHLGSALRTTFPFGWRFAWRKEYPSFCAWLAGLAGLEVYKGVLAYGWTWSWSNWLWTAVMGACGSFMVFATLRKRARRASSRQKLRT